MGREKERGAPPPSPSPIRTRREEARGPPLAAHLSLHQGPYGPLLLPGVGGVPVTLRLPGFLRNHPEHFRCPNIAIQYINLNVSTMSSIIVMSVITFGTPN